MAIEIERKFLVCGDAWRAAAGAGLFCEQGYLASSATAATVRVRRMGASAYLTVKGPSAGFARAEFEYAIPEAEAVEMLQTLCGDRVLLKRRFRIEHGSHLWEVDEFLGANCGLVLAEIELESEGEFFERPSWLGAEVSDDPRYLNASLVDRPFSEFGGHLN